MRRAGDERSETARPHIRTILLRSPVISETLARFCRYLCAAAISMPNTLRNQLAVFSYSTATGFFPELERIHAPRLATSVLRVFAPKALRSVGLEGEARECEMAETAPHNARWTRSSLR
jgi:hypothetical protein